MLGSQVRGVLNVRRATDAQGVDQLRRGGGVAPAPAFVPTIVFPRETVAVGAVYHLAGLSVYPYTVAPEIDEANTTIPGAETFDDSIALGEDSLDGPREGRVVATFENADGPQVAEIPVSVVAPVTVQGRRLRLRATAYATVYDYGTDGPARAALLINEEDGDPSVLLREGGGVDTEGFETTEPDGAVVVEWPSTVTMSVVAGAVDVEVLAP